jgi:hypothetical protein
MHSTSFEVEKSSFNKKLAADSAQQDSKLLGLPVEGTYEAYPKHHRLSGLSNLSTMTSPRSTPKNQRPSLGARPWELMFISGYGFP